MSDAHETAPSASTAEEGGAPEVLVEDRENVLVITLNRPQAKNAMTLNMARLIADALDRLDGEPADRKSVV